MPLLVTGAAGRWDRTPKTCIRTVRHRLTACPDLGDARRTQCDAFDWALDQLEATPALKVSARAGEDTLWKRLTAARASGALERAPLALQRAATAQAHTAFALRETALAEKARVTLTEQDEETTPRTLRRLAKPLKPARAYRRSHPSKRPRRQAIHVLEGVRVVDGARCKLRVLGVGIVTTRNPVNEIPRSAQLVERNGSHWLHIQHGETWPEPKDADGPPSDSMPESPTRCPTTRVCTGNDRTPLCCSTKPSASTGTADDAAAKARANGAGSAHRRNVCVGSPIAFRTPPSGTSRRTSVRPTTSSCSRICRSAT